MNTVKQTPRENYFDLLKELKGAFGALREKLKAIKDKRAELKQMQDLLAKRTDELNRLNAGEFNKGLTDEQLENLHDIARGRVRMCNSRIAQLEREFSALDCTSGSEINIIQPAAKKASTLLNALAKESIAATVGRIVHPRHWFEKEQMTDELLKLSSAHSLAEKLNWVSKRADDTLGKTALTETGLKHFSSFVDNSEEFLTEAANALDLIDLIK